MNKQNHCENQWHDNWEPYEGRLSRTVLREVWGEVPLAYSLTPLRINIFQNAT